MPQLRFFCFCCVLNHAQDVVHRKGKVLFGLKPAYRQILRQAVDCKNRFYAFLIGAFYAKIFARRATPMTTLPRRLWVSSLPSPVKI